MVTTGTIVTDGPQEYSSASIVVDMNSTNLCSDFPAYPSEYAVSAAGAVLDGSPLICGGIGPDYNGCWCECSDSRFRIL